jgi:nicotinate-nucleotide adenylyltransferase
MRLGIFGGTFNPIHNSHLYVARAFAHQLALDRVILIPTYSPPHKDAPNLASPEDRLAMCRLAVKYEQKLTVSDYETSRPEKSFTYRTLEHLAGEHPSASLFFLMGADMFLTLEAWREPQRVFAAATLCAVAREKGELEHLAAYRPILEARGANCILLEIAPKPLSSTMVRDAVAAGRNISDMVTDAVAAYIASRGLYVGD